MNNPLSNFSLSKKFLLLTGIFSLSFVSMLITVFISQSHLNKSAALIEQSDRLKIDLSNLRVSVNALRGEIFVTLLADPKSMNKEAAESYDGYRTHRTNIEDLGMKLTDAQQTLQDERLSLAFTNVITSVNKLTTLTDAYVRNNTISLQEDSVSRMMISRILREYVPLFTEFRKAINATYKITDELRERARLQYQETEHRRNTLLVSFFLVGLILVLTFSLYLGWTISRPILKTKLALEKISHGEVPAIDTPHGRDEAANMLRSLKTLVTNLENLRTFTSDVGNGNFETTVTLFGNKGAIAEALLSMKNNLKNASRKESQAKWVTQSLAEAGTLLRMRYENASALYDALIRFAVRALSATQGSLFVTADEEDQGKLNLVACYAYDRKKYLQKSISFGEGLAGQACLEKDMIYMTDIPQNYLKITSGLGEANPGCIVILPLVNNDLVQGILEIASFNTLEEHHLKFLKQFADLVAADIAREKFNTKMQQLLEVSQQRTEELRATEEELRQSMEELTATQEELQRRLSEAEFKREAEMV